MYNFNLAKKKYSIILFLLFLCHISNGQEQSVEKFEYVVSLIDSSEKIKEGKKELLLKAFAESDYITNDSLHNEAIYKLSTSFFSLRDSFNFKKINKIGIKLSEDLKDTATLANHYWDLGAFYKRHQQVDSAYISYDISQKLHKKIGKSSIAGRLLLRMARIEKDVKDYTGSEITTTNAIKIFEPLNDYKNLYNCYNNLGIVFNNLEEYGKAIKYHHDALGILSEIEDHNNDIKKAISLNNIGIVYQNLNNHEEAINIYNEALKNDSLPIKNIRLYATLIDNLAYSKFKLNDFKDLPDLFYKALHIRDSLDTPAGIVINKLHLSEYYWKLNDTLKSYQYAIEGRNLAKKVESNDHLLDLYKLLSEIEPKNASEHLRSYIRLTDSLTKVERSTRDKFTRIKFETDQYITKNKKLSDQINWIVAISTIIIFFAFLIYIITQQRTRNKELEMEQQQQRANEEIYNLMIDQQDKIEEGRKREKERISLELHDGILGRLFGTRLSLGSLNAKNDDDSKKIRQQYINELQSIEEEVRNISHELGLDNFDKSTSYSTMITNLLEEQSKITNFKYQIEDDDRIVWTDIPGHIKINIYRIIQESIQNINKYAQAENVILDFKKNDNRIILTIKDDGVGFDQDKRSSGIGLKNMKSRVALLHGQFTINSIPGKGTSISVDVPMT
ncbi:histidine kinase [Kordia periserrulae]|uniref:Oxygen sensor histidine kinase NreB n=1 Tax=Kordia periserrulae TaxID=701523 RepID=A0A2T6BZE1_9FLAO|nr:sensor histidine kinase [Kordia periserrulae]PTX61429.1 histidine kinase [Kordia periserrulae]